MARAATAIADVAGDRQRRSVGVDRAIRRERVVDLEIVAEGEIGRAGLEQAILERDRSGAYRAIVGYLQYARVDGRAARIGICAGKDQRAVAELLHLDAGNGFTDVVGNRNLSDAGVVDDAAERAGKRKIHRAAVDGIGLRA